MPIEPLYLLIAFLPLVAYLLVLGVIRISGRVLVTTGGRDIAALGFAVCGLVAVGPLELFFPKAAAGVFGGWIWVTLGLFYSLVVTLIALTSRPRLVVYGRGPEEVTRALLNAAKEMDPDSTTEPDGLQVFLPRSGVRLRAAGHKGIDSASIESFEPIISQKFWDTLLSNLRRHASDLPKPGQRRGGMMVLVAVAIATAASWQAIRDPQEIVNAFAKWIFR